MEDACQEIGHFGACAGAASFGTEEEFVRLSDSIYLFPNRNIGLHDNVYEGTVRSSVYGLRPCVIKFAELQEQIVREAEVLTKLGSHTNVIAIIQSGTYCDVFEDRMYLALDKCHNENLRQYLANRKAAGMDFELNQALDYAKQLIEGVMYIHDNNVIHLDLKPSNVLLSQDLSLIKIADFGLSIIVRSPKSKVYLKRQFGTNGYRPIESFGNDVVSMKSDIFSLGTTLFHLLSNGNDAFGNEEHIFIHNVLNDATDTSGLLVDNPATTEHLIKSMVSKERCRRPNILEVFDHPCWSGNETKIDFEYFDDDEIDDSAIDEKDSDPTESRIASSLIIDNDKAFIKKMREMGFHREPSIILFDHTSKHLYRFNHKNISSEQMHKYHECMSTLDFSAVSFGEYIYVFKEDRSVYRLEYGDVMASWEKMNDAIGQPGYRPKVVASGKRIFLVGAFCQSMTKKSVSKYDPYSDQWERSQDKPTATYGSSLLCNKEFLYCFGGFSDEGLENKPTNRVERMNLQTMKWCRVSDMIWKPSMTSAIEYQDKILVVGDHFVTKGSLSTTIEIYTPKVDQWSEVTQIDGNYLTWISKIFAFGGNLYVVGTEGIHSYDIDANEWSEVTPYSDEVFVEQFVLIQLSR